MSIYVDRYSIPEDKLIASFIEEMGRAGIYPIDSRVIKADGEIHRFRDRNDKPNTLNGWWVLFPETLSGAFGNWRKGVTHKFNLRDCYQLVKGDPHTLRVARNQLRQANHENRLKRQSVAAQRAYKIWQATASPNINHPYLMKKMIPPFKARQNGSCLVLEIMDFDYKLHSLQFIDAFGNKKLLRDGLKKGNFIPVQIQEDMESIHICEGFATGATIAQLFPTVTVLAAIDAGNLRPVAVNARKDYPCANLCICADDDRLTGGNPGLTKAREAALYSRAKLYTPPWPEGSPIDLSDFNDLDCWLKVQNGVVL